jgi:hypothetical protein
MDWEDQNSLIAGLSCMENMEKGFSSLSQSSIVKIHEFCVGSKGLRAGCVPMEVKFYKLKNVMAFFFQIIVLGWLFAMLLAHETQLCSMQNSWLFWIYYVCLVCEDSLDWVHWEFQCSFEVYFHHLPTQKNKIQCNPCKGFLWKKCTKVVKIWDFLSPP